MKRYIIIAVLAVVTCATSCVHKDLCVDHREHAHRYHIEIIADYRYDWEEHIYEEATDWEYRWPDEFMLTYDELRPTKPTGLRVVNYNEDGTNSNLHNIKPDGGVVTLYEGLNDMLFYNNDTEYIIFSRSGTDATTRATTRTLTRAEYEASAFAVEGERTVSPPDMLFANYVEDYLPEKVVDPTPFEITLQPLVFTYKIRFEFADGIEYASSAMASLSGMASSVELNTGETSEESATILFDDLKIVYTNEAKDEGYIRAVVKSFGAPAFPHPNYPTRTDVTNGLKLEVRLRNNKIWTADVDVTDQIKLQPHGGVIIVKDLVIDRNVAVEGSGGFEPVVDDWGEEVEIPLPL